MTKSQLLTRRECIMLAYNFEEHSLGKLMILLALNKLNQEGKNNIGEVRCTMFKEACV